MEGTKFLLDYFFKNCIYFLVCKDLNHLYIFFEIITYFFNFLMCPPYPHFYIIIHYVMTKTKVGHYENHGYLIHYFL